MSSMAAAMESLKDISTLVRPEDCTDCEKFEGPGLNAVEPFRSTFAKLFTDCRRFTLFACVGHAGFVD